MKYSNWIGIAAALILVAACFMPWTFYPDLGKSFTGFFTQGNTYGKPGKFFIFMSVVAIIFFLLPKIWAKRWNLMVCALIVAYAIKTFIIFSSCYMGICPQKEAGIWVMTGSAVLMLVMALLPDLKLKQGASSAKSK